MVKDIYDYNNLEYQPYHEKIIFNKEDFEFFTCILLFFSGRMTHPHPKETHLCL